MHDAKAEATVHLPTPHPRPLTPTLSTQPNKRERKKKTPKKSFRKAPNNTKPVFGYDGKKTFLFFTPAVVWDGTATVIVTREGRGGFPDLGLRGLNDDQGMGLNEWPGRGEGGKRWRRVM